MEPRVRERIENRKNVNNSKIGFEVARPEIRVPARNVSLTPLALMNFAHGGSDIGNYIGDIP